jgi:hypothetical protein
MLTLGRIAMNSLTLLILSCFMRRHERRRSQLRNKTASQRKISVLRTIRYGSRFGAFSQRSVTPLRLRRSNVRLRQIVEVGVFLWGFPAVQALSLTRDNRVHSFDARAASEIVGAEEVRRRPRSPDGWRTVQEGVEVKLTSHPDTDETLILCRSADQRAFRFVEAFETVDAGEPRRVVQFLISRRTRYFLLFFAFPFLAAVAGTPLEIGNGYFEFCNYAHCGR